MAHTPLKKYRYFFIFAALSLIGCSGSDNKQPSIEASNEGNTTLQAVSPTAIQISAEEFSNIDITGTWRRRLFFSSTKEVDLRVNGNDTPALKSRAGSFLDVIFVEQINETSTLTKYCDSLPAKLTEINPENNIIINDTSDSSSTPSENSRIAKKYYKISDKYYRIDFYTNDKLDGYFELEKHSSLLAFDFGMLSFFMSDRVDLNASEDVCGIVDLSTITFTDLPNDAITFDPISVHSNSYSISAPYEDSFVTLKMSFIGAIDKTTYTVTQDISDTELPVMVEISSPIFNTPPDDVDTTTVINGSTGVVTIGSISDTSVSGDYDITLENGEILVGNFSFEIK